MSEVKELERKLSTETDAEEKKNLEKQIRDAKSSIRFDLYNSKLCLELILKLTNNPDIVSVILLNKTNIGQVAGMVNLYWLVWVGMD